MEGGCHVAGGGVGWGGGGNFEMFYHHFCEYFTNIFLRIFLPNGDGVGRSC